MKKTEGIHRLAQTWRAIPALYREFPNLIRSVLFALVVILALGSIWRIASSHRVLFPVAAQAEATAYSDGSPYENNGKSVVLGLKRDSGAIEFRWCLHEGFSDPYAGISFPALDNNAVIDIRDFDRIVFDVASDADEDFRVVLRFHQAGITHRANPATYRNWVAEGELSRGRQTLRLPFSKFSTPPWWYTLYKTRETDCGPIDLQKMLDFQLETGEKSANDIDRTWRVYNVYLERDDLRWWLTLTVLVPLLALLVWRLPTLFRKPGPVVAIAYQKLELGSYQSEGLARVVASISLGFSEKGLSLAIVADRSNVSQAKITELIQAHFGMTFKEYLNTIRLDEAMRLLRETDRYVSDIAYAVGYNSVPHFNRIFKTRFGHSPNEFRKAEAAAHTPFED